MIYNMNNSRFISSIEADAKKYTCIPVHVQTETQI